MVGAVSQARQACPCRTGRPGVAIRPILDEMFSNRSQQVDLVGLVGVAVAQARLRLANDSEEVLGSAFDPEDVADERTEVVSMNPVARCNEVALVGPRPANGVARDLHVIADQMV